MRNCPGNATAWFEAQRIETGLEFGPGPEIPEAAEAVDEDD